MFVHLQTGCVQTFSIQLSPAPSRDRQKHALCARYRGSHTICTFLESLDSLLHLLKRSCSSSTATRAQPRSVNVTMQATHRVSSHTCPRPASSSAATRNRRERGVTVAALDGHAHRGGAELDVNTHTRDQLEVRVESSSSDSCFSSSRRPFAASPSNVSEMARMWKSRLPEAICRA